MNAFVRRNATFFKHEQPSLATERRKRKSRRMKPDRDSNAIVKERSGGRCETVWVHQYAQVGVGTVRCPNSAVHIHHKLGGHGVRGRGESALAENKLHLCLDCHKAAHDAKSKRHNALSPDEAK